MSQKDLEIIEALAKNEECISDLYKSYSEKFADYKEFWAKMSGDELEHASRLRSLVVMPGVRFNPDRFNLMVIRNFSHNVTKEIETSRTGYVSRVNALSVSVSFEESLLEHRYFEVFDYDLEELKEVFSRLQSETQAHLNSVRDLWSRNK
jgi:hypothetical protein